MAKTELINSVIMNNKNAQTIARFPDFDLGLSLPRLIFDNVASLGRAWRGILRAILVTSVFRIGDVAA
jgi:hypothetical protein